MRTIKTVNFTNVKKNNTNGKKAKLWSIENIDVSYSYYKEEQHNPLIENNEIVRHRADWDIIICRPRNIIEPLKRTIKSKSPWYDIDQGS